MNIFLGFILAVLVGTYLIQLLVEMVNLSHFQEDLPEEFRDHYQEDKYRSSQKYLKDTTTAELVQSSIYTPMLIAFLLFGGFNFVDNFVRGFELHEIGSGLIFTGILIFAGQILNLPSSLYHTFVIEERYGFNKSTFKTFMTDLIKSWVLTALLGGLLLSGILYFFGRAGEWAWVYVWILITLFQIILMYLAPVVIMPLFNTFTPLDECDLKKAIEQYAQAENFKLKGIFTMDGSKRSTKSNAFFTGFGKFRRIVLFDTLIENHSVPELVAIIAHEMGHYKKKHIQKLVVISILSTGLMLFFLSCIINNRGLFDAFKMDHVSIYASIVFFAFLYSPISMIISTIVNMLSRKFEYEADRYACDTSGNPDSLIDGLKKLSADNLSNLTPHPLKVFFEYSHPPVLQRIHAIKMNP